MMTDSKISPVGQQTHTGRNIVLCFDGTTNHFGREKITNVVRIYEILSKDANYQLCYYQAGIGSYDAKIPLDSQNASLRSRVSKTLDAMSASSIKKHILGGYRYLMANYKQGDVIYMFGFSRGAYTARALCGMLDKVGLVISGNEEQVAFAWRMYRSHDKDVHKVQTNSDNPNIHFEGKTLASEFQAIFSQEVNVHFLGLWDTVQSVGIWNRYLLPDARNGFIRHFYHALAIDERRSHFQPTLYDNKSPDKYNSSSTSSSKEEHLDKRHDHDHQTNVHELWFRGDHTDVGGRFKFKNRTEESLANLSFRWIVRAAAMSSHERTLLFDYDTLSKYYNILFYDGIPSIAPPPLQATSKNQQLLTIPTERWTEELDYLCSSGSHVLRYVNEFVPSLSFSEDVKKEVSQILKKHRRINIWTFIHILTFKNPAGYPRVLPDNALFHPSVQVISEPPILNFDKGFMVTSAVQTRINEKSNAIIPALHTKQNADWAIRKLHSMLDRPLHSKEKNNSLDRLLLHLNIGVWYFTRYICSSSIEDINLAIKNHSEAMNLLEILINKPTLDIKSHTDERDPNSSSQMFSIEDEADKYRGYPIMHMSGRRERKLSTESALNSSVPSSPLKGTNALQSSMGVFLTRIQAVNDVPTSLGAEQSLKSPKSESNSGIGSTINTPIAADSETFATAKPTSEKGSKLAAVDEEQNTAISLMRSKNELYILRAVCVSNYANLLLSGVDHQFVSDIQSVHARLMEAEESVCSFAKNNSANPSAQMSDESTWRGKDLISDLQAQILCNVASSYKKLSETSALTSLTLLDEAVRLQKSAFNKYGDFMSEKTIPKRRFELCSLYIARAEKLWSDRRYTEAINDRERALSEVREILAFGLRKSQETTEKRSWPKQWLADCQTFLQDIVDPLFVTSYIRGSTTTTVLENDNILNSIIEKINLERTSFMERTLGVKDIQPTLLYDMAEEFNQQTEAQSFITPVQQYAPGDSSQSRISLFGRFLRPVERLSDVSDSSRLLNLSNWHFEAFLARDCVGQLNEKSIDSSIVFLRKSIEATNEAEKRNLLTKHLADRLYIRWHRLRRIVDLNEAIEKYKSLTKFTKDLTVLQKLGDTYMNRFECYGKESDLKQSIEQYNKCLRMTSKSMLEHRRLVRTLAFAQLQLSLVKDTEQSLKLEEARNVDDSIEKKLNLLFVTKNLQKLHMLLIRFGRTGERLAIDEAISTGVKMLDQFFHRNNSERDISILCLMLSKLLLVCFKRFGDVQDYNIKKALDLCETAVEDHDADGTVAFSRDIMGQIYHCRFIYSDDIADINAAIAHYEYAINYMPYGLVARSNTLIRLGRTLFMRFEKFGNGSDLLKSIERYEEAVKCTSDEDQNKAQYLSELGMVCLRRFLIIPDADEYENAVEHLERALALVSDLDSSNKALYNAELLLIYAAKLVLEGNVSKVYDTVTVTLQHALIDPIPEHRADIYMCYSTIKDLILLSSKRVKSHTLDLSDAIGMDQTIRRALAEVYSTQRILLSNTKLSTFGTPERLSDLEKLNLEILDSERLMMSINKLEEQFSSETENSESEDLSEDVAIKAKITNDLCNLLFKRFEMAGNVMDIDQASEMQAKICYEPIFSTIDTSDRSRYLNRLGIYLSKQFEALGDFENLDRAILAYTDAIKAMSNDATSRCRAEVLHGLGKVLSLRFEQYDKKKSGVYDIDNAILAQRLASRYISEDDEFKPTILYELAKSSFRRFEIFGERKDLSKAKASLDQAFGLMTDDDMDKPTYLNFIKICDYHVRRVDNLKAHKHFHNTTESKPKETNFVDEKEKDEELSDLMRRTRGIGHHMYALGNDAGTHRRHVHFA